MCVSAQVDLVAGVAVCAVGADAWRHVEHPNERPLAAIPFVLGAHLIIESFVWRGLVDEPPASYTDAAIWVYLLIAFVILPVLVPLAIRTLEPLARHRALLIFPIVGIVVALVLLVDLIRGPVGASLERYHVAYSVPVAYGGLTVVAYVFATCGAMLVSVYRRIVVFGAANLAAVLLLAWFTKSGFVSLWCWWAALTSLAIAAHLRFTKRARPPVPLFA